MVIMEQNLWQILLDGINLSENNSNGFLVLILVLGIVLIATTAKAIDKLSGLITTALLICCLPLMLLFLYFLSLYKGHNTVVNHIIEIYEVIQRGKRESTPKEKNSLTSRLKEWLKANSKNKDER